MFWSSHSENSVQRGGKKNKVDRISFISFNFKFFQRSRLGDVRKQQQQQSPPSYFNGGCQKHNHSFLSLTLALFKSICWNHNGYTASWCGPVMPMIAPEMEYHRKNANFGAFTMKQFSSALLHLTIHCPSFSFLLTATWVLKCVQENQAQEQFAFPT